MSLFNRHKNESAAPAANAPRLAVLGSGCSRCRELLKAAGEAAAGCGLDLEPEYITDLKTVMSFGVMSMPALIVGGRVVSAGRVLKTDEIEALIREKLC